MKSDISSDARTLLDSARETRAAARRFADVVKRFGTEMPDHLDRFHTAMTDTRATACRLRGDAAPADGRDARRVTRSRMTPSRTAAAE